MRNEATQPRRYNFVLDDSDTLLPCPHCGSTDLELANTHTPSYWIECVCSARVSGEYGPELTMGAVEAQHRASAESAIQNWNRRAPVEAP